MAVRLLIDGGLGRREFALPDGSSAVGRGPVGNVVRLEERNVSRRHARFQVAAGSVTIEDLGSRNGTFVNGERIQGRRRLRSGDRIRVGDFELVLENGAFEPSRTPEPSGERNLPPPLPNRVGPRAPAPAEPGPAARPPAPLRRATEALLRTLESVVRFARWR